MHYAADGVVIPVLQLLAFHLSAATFSGYLHYKTNSKLKNMQNCDRKKILVRFFSCLWVAWVITSFPHAIFETIYGREVYIDKKGENLDLNALDLLKFARRANQYKKHSDVEKLSRFD